jgi:hypothetical protein
MQRRALLALAPLFAGGCASTIPADVTPSSNPASATSGIRDVRPANVIGEYHPRQVVEPKPWRQRNDEQAPKSGGDS